ncbi:MAG: ribosomal protein S18-alanine N-acetyltransferase [Sphingomicrobium sp.]
MIESRPRPAANALRLRAGDINDLDAVMSVMTTAFRPRFGEGWTRSQCAGILPMAGVSLTLAEENGAMVGFSLMRAVADEAELLLVAVVPGAQRRGVGARMIAHFIDDSRRRGAHRLHLEVRDGNDAVSLYRAAGFEAAGRRRDYYRGSQGDRYDALTLMLVDRNL